MKSNQEMLNALDTKYLKCTALMVLHVGTYLAIKEKHLLLPIGSMSACDALGMESLALATSTTIMYCPEEMAQLSDQELQSIGTDFIEKMEELNPGNGMYMYGGDHYIGDLLEFIRSKFYEAYIGQEVEDISIEYEAAVEPVHILKYMIEHFKPQYIISRTLQIGEKMETLGCN